MIRATGLAAILCLGLFTPALFAQDFDAGLEAYVAGDYTTALKEWLPLAEGGNAEAQYNLAMMYRYGDGVTLDYTEAMRWFRLAAGLGHEVAQSQISLMYLKGEGVPPDPLLAYVWSDIAATSGNEIWTQVRDEIAAGLTPEQLAQAQALSKTCTDSGLVDCGD